MKSAVFALLVVTSTSFCKENSCSAFTPVTYNGILPRHSTDIPSFDKIRTQSQSRRRRRSNSLWQLLTMQTTNRAGQQAVEQVPKFIKTLNASTKWLVTLGNTIGVWSRPRRYHGPYIVVGSIAAVYLTQVLKKLINQSRPADAPFADPGMPSSHSLVSFFAAVGWIGSLGSYGSLASTVALLAAAATVAVLRVVCGYHSVPQIAVGAALGSVLGQSWILLGNLLHMSNPRLLLIGAWAAYLSGSALFITTNMSKWTARDKHL